MLKKIQFQFEYDGTAQGDTDRDALKALCDTEITKGTVVPSVEHGDHVETSGSTVDGDTLSGTLFYVASNEGIADWDAFWATMLTEYARATVLKNDNSDALKHDCYHDVRDTCRNFSVAS